MQQLRLKMRYGTDECLLWDEYCSASTGTEFSQHPSSYYTTELFSSKLALSSSFSEASYSVYLFGELLANNFSSRANLVCSLESNFFTIYGY